jgi:hypothetical protein
MIVDCKLDLQLNDLNKNLDPVLDILTQGFFVKY